MSRKKMMINFLVIIIVFGDFYFGIVWGETIFLNSDEDTDGE